MKVAEDLRRAVLQAGIEGRLTGGRCEGWRFVRLGNVGITSTGTTPSTEHREYYNGDIPFIGPADMNFYGTMNYDTNKKLTQEGMQKSRCVNAGSVLQVCIGTIGKVNVTEKLVCFNQQINAITPTIIDSYFLCYVLRSPYWQKQMQDNASQTTLPILNRRKWENLIIPLPPLDEQHRIVSRLDSILPRIAELESAENELEALERKFPGDMRDSLLQAAIQGELTGGTENWRWVRLGDVVRVISGTSYEKHNVCDKGIRIIRGGNLVDEKIVLKDDDVFLPYQYANKEKQIQQNDIVIIASTGSLKGIGRAAFVDTNLDEPIQIGAFLRIIRPVDSSLADYLRVIFAGQYYRSHISSVVNGIGIKNIREKHITELLIPLPPIEQQHKIVSRLNELLPLCDSLENLKLNAESNYPQRQNTLRNI